MTDDLPSKEPARRFSFLVDQEYQRKRDEAAAAAAAQNTYVPGVKDFALFIYFCTNVFLIGTPLLNSNAVVKVWKRSETFRIECGNPDEPSDWCHEQQESSKAALILYQSALAATGMMGGVLVDTFSASMCLLISHIMFAIGSHFLRGISSNGIFLGCFLQGVAGELLLNSALPICGLFGTYQSLMLLILTLFSDLSVLFYPLISTFLAPESKLSLYHDEFYKEVHSWMIWYAVIAAFVGTFILPVDDSGNLMPVSSKASVLESHNRVPRGVLNSSTEQRFSPLQRHTQHDLEAHDDIDDYDDDDPLDEDNPNVLLLQPEELKKTKRRKTPKSLWGLRFTRQLRTIQFFICISLFTICTIRNSFYLNNNQPLLEGAGDDGTLTEGFSWLLVLGAVFGPISWHVNDNWPEMSALCLFGFLGLTVNVLVATELKQLQWITIIIFVANRSFLSSTLLTYIAGCFGFKHFPAMAVVIGVLGGFANFINIFIDQYTDKELNSNYHYANYLMIALGVFVFFLIFLQYLFPTLRDEGPEPTEKIDELKRAVETVTNVSRPPQSGKSVGEEKQISQSQRDRSQQSGHVENMTGSSENSGNNGSVGAIVDEEDGWEDESEDSRARL